MGYHQAGFEVVGVDIEPQPRYPFEHHVGDALDYLLRHHEEFDAIHASPPCQRYSTMTKRHGRQDDHPDLVGETRTALAATGLPYVIENVAGAPLVDPVMLCGMVIDWMTSRELAEALPPVYTRHLGVQLRAAVSERGQVAA